MNEQIRADRRAETVSSLKKRVDERSDSRSLGQDYESAKKKKNQYDWQEPEFLAFLEEQQKLTKKTEHSM
jgi:hypothetical protein